MSDSAIPTNANSADYPKLSRAEIQFIQKLQRKKHRLESGLLFIEGIRLCMEALRSNWKIRKIICSEQLQSTPENEYFFANVNSRTIPVYLVKGREFDKISNTIHAQGVGAIIEIKASPKIEHLLQKVEDQTLIAIERLADPGNLGTIMRTAEWLGIDGIILGEKCVAWHNDKVVRASMGAVFHLPVFQATDFAAFLNEARLAGFSIFAAHQNGEVLLSEVKKNTRNILLFGDEAHGLSDDVKKTVKTKIRIPGRGKVESLNVAAAAAIIMARFCE